MKRILIITLGLLFVAGCPKPTGPDGKTSPTPAATDSPAPTGEATPSADETMIRYHWSGGFSIFEFYTLTITEKSKGATASFIMKPVKGEERRLVEPIPYEDYSEIRELFEAAKFDTLEQKPRGMKIMDIGRTVISLAPADGDKAEVFEDPDTTTTGDLKEIRAWFDRRIKDYLERVSKPEEKKSE